MVSLSYPTRLLLAVLAYLAAYVVASNVAWALRKPLSGRLAQVVSFLRLWGGRLWLGDVARTAYYLIGPYWVLRQGWASPLDLGLADLDWIRGLGITAALGVSSAVLLWLLWRQYARHIEAHPPMPQALRAQQPWGWAFALREAILLESGWALIRSPLLLLTGPYFSVYAALTLVFLAGLLNARTRYELAVPGLREGVILTAQLAVVTATLYVFTHNLWLCIALHLALRLLVLRTVEHGMQSVPVGDQQPVA
jgi:hypothetical protein